MIMPRATAPATFSILDAVLFGYRFALYNAKYLAIIGIVPFIAELATGYLADKLMDSKQSALTNLMLGLPSICMAGWYMFLVIRLAVLGERADRLPADRPFLAERGRLMWASILTWMLFNMMIMLAAMIILSATRTLQAGPNALMAIANLVTITFCFWAARFGVLHYLAAVDYPLRLYVTKAQGFMTSFRWIGLALLCVLPCAFVQQGFMLPFMPDGIPSLQAMTDVQKIALMLIGSAFSVIMTTIVTGACAHALKQMLGTNRHRA